MTRPLTIAPLAGALSLVLCQAALAAPEPAPAAIDLDRVEVHGHRVDGYDAKSSRTATRTDTLLRDVPQAITVITEQAMRDQAMNSLMDVLRYVPGVGIAQGEGNRDTPVLRGNSSTADFFVDGVRDDVQYIRDTYNIERVEALKGANSMIFGRGGSGGVVNRVTKTADWHEHRELSLQAGSFGRSRATIDMGQPVNDNATFRVQGLVEDSGSYREDVQVERYGINPTVSLRLGDNTIATLGYEHFRDDRVADRGVPSRDGRPLPTEPETFFGNQQLSPVWARVNALTSVIDHVFESGVSLRNRTRVADYDKYYQNVFANGAATATDVSLGAYANRTDRTNYFNQTDVTFALNAGAITHTLLVGAEFGRQVTDNFRTTGYFGAPGSDATSVRVLLGDPIYRGPVEFRQSGSDANNHGVARQAALYVQDQIEFSPNWQAVVGLRHDRFEVDFRNNRNGTTLDSSDDLLSPRIGLIYKPVEPVSIYASYSLAYSPRAGEQLASLNANTRNLDPEEFRNAEIGAKWDLRSELSLTAAVYRLDRKNVAVTDPADPSRYILVDGQYSEGFELGLAGKITDAWSMMGGYAYQRGEILRPTRSDLHQLPEHSASLWNRYDFSPMWGAGIGVIHRDEMFASADNRVTLPAFTRVDAAVYFTLSPRLQMQLNVENLLDKTYYASAHNNNNITPGAPRSAYLGFTLKF